MLLRTNDSTVKILDLGCGQGDEIKEALTNFKDKNFEITANDTSADALEKYQKNNSSHVKRIIKDRLENIPKILSEKYDLILLSHSLYAVNTKDLFQDLLKLLSENGIILIFLDSKEGNVKKIKEKFWPSVFNTPFNENTAEDITLELRNNNISYQTMGIPYHIDLDKLNHLCEDGFTRLFVPFALRKQNIDPTISNQVVTFAQTLEKDRKIENKSLAIFIHKQ